MYSRLSATCARRSSLIARLSVFIVASATALNATAQTPCTDPVPVYDELAPNIIERPIYTVGAGGNVVQSFNSNPQRPTVGMDGCGRLMFAASVIEKSDAQRLA